MDTNQVLEKSEPKMIIKQKDIIEGMRRHSASMLIAEKAAPK
jgi:hypothetical protein